MGETQGASEGDRRAPRCQRPPALPFGQRLRPLAVSLRSAHIAKNIFRHRKVRYRGLEKNTSQLRVLFALSNLYMARRELKSAATA